MTHAMTRARQQLAAVFAALLLLAGIGVASTVNAPAAAAINGSTASHSGSKPANFPYKVSGYSIKVTKTNGSVVWLKPGQKTTNAMKVCNTHTTTRKLLVYTGVSRDGTGWSRAGACHTPNRKGTFQYMLIA